MGPSAAQASKQPNSKANDVACRIDRIPPVDSSPRRPLLSLPKIAYLPHNTTNIPLNAGCDTFCGIGSRGSDTG